MTDFQAIIEQHILENQTKLVAAVADKLVAEARRQSQAEYNHIANKMRDQITHQDNQYNQLKTAWIGLQEEHRTALEFLAERGLLDEYRTFHPAEQDEDNDDD